MAKTKFAVVLGAARRPRFLMKGEDQTDRRTDRNGNPTYFYVETFAHSEVAKIGEFCFSGRRFKGTCGVQMLYRGLYTRIPSP